VTGGVTFHGEEALNHLEATNALLSGTDPRIVLFAHKQHTAEIDKAFLSGRSPEGPRWAPRRHPYPWPLLKRTGTLRGMLLSGFGIKTKDGRQKIFGKVREAFYLGGYTRGGGGGFTTELNRKYPAHKPGIVVAASVLFGRKKARSAAGYKKQIHGYIRNRGRITFHGGGTKLDDPASTGITPPRPFFGFSLMAKLRVRQYARREINRVFN